MSLCRLAYRNPHFLRCTAFLKHRCLENSAPGSQHEQHNNCIRQDYYRLLQTQRYSDWSHGEHDGSSKKGRTISMSVLGLFSLAFWRKEDDMDEEKEQEQDIKIWDDFKVTLYQYQTCPFCTKTRTFLQYYQVPFESVEVHPIFKKEIKFSEKYKKVPILTIDTKDGRHELQDSSLIISILGTYMKHRGKRNLSEIIASYPETEIMDEDGKTKQVVLNKYWIIAEQADRVDTTTETDPRQTEAEWRRWTDDHLVHLISPNVYRTYREAYQAFAHHVELGKFKGTWEGVVAKVFGALAMWLISKKLKKKYCQSDDVRLDLYRACHEWRKALGTKKFMGGEQPNLADLSVYAVLNVMDGLVSFEDLEQNTKITSWYCRVKQAIQDKQSI